jgi:hypothetical protein
MTDDTTTNDTPTGDTAFDWSPLGEQWWTQTAATVGANKKQLMFACAKYRGCSNAQCAKESGYGSTADARKAEGYRVFKSNTVQSLLALAAAEEGGKSKGDITPQEARTILSKLARGSDPAIKIKALESLAKMDAAEKNTPAHDYDNKEGNPLHKHRMFRDVLNSVGHRHAATLCVLMHSNTGVYLGGMPLLHDVWHKLQSEPLGMTVWKSCLDTHSESMKEATAQNLLNLEFGWTDRKEIWAEIGKPPIGPSPGNTARKESRGGNGHAYH